VGNTQLAGTKAGTGHFVACGSHLHVIVSELKRVPSSIEQMKKKQVWALIKKA